MKKTGYLIGIIILGMIAATILSATSLAATKATPTTTKLFFTPASANFRVGDNVTVKLNVSNVKDLYALQFDIQYNSKVLKYLSIKPGGFLNKDGSMIFPIGPTSTSNGLIKNYGISRLGTVTGVNGNGMLLEIQFKAISTGSSSVQIVSNRWVSGALFDSHLLPIPFSAARASISVKSK